MGIQDPRLRSLVERFTDVRLSGFKNRVFEFFDAGDDVAHLFAASVLEFEVHSQSLFKGSPFEVSVRLPDRKVLIGQTFEIYLSRSGVRLLELANERKPGHGIEAVIFLEANRGDVIFCFRNCAPRGLVRLPISVGDSPFFPYFEQRSQSLAARVRTAREG